MKRTFVFLSLSVVLAVATLAQSSPFAKGSMCKSCCHDKCGQTCCQNGCTESCCQSK